MPEYVINGISVNFPFEPYDVQSAYMHKVIECLQTGTNGVLESPTGTGKTLSLLCSTLAWVLTKKAQVQSSSMINKGLNLEEYKNIKDPNALLSHLNEAADGKPTNWGVSKIIYASRTHSQLNQAMQELKQTSYSFMKSVVLGSRDQLCIHPEVMKEANNSNKVQMCKLRIATKSCSFHNRVETKKDHPDFKAQNVMDIEDLVKIGQKLKMCPYYGAKELVQEADITFMPYNYLLDPNARKANKVELNNTVVILDEAHNVEKLCEESASIQIKSSDIAMAIDDITHLMKAVESNAIGETGDEAKDFNVEDLALLKEMLLEFEKAVDEIIVDNKAEGTTFPASLMFELLAKANITSGTKGMILGLTDKIVQFLAMSAQNTMFRKGMSLMVLNNMLTVVFSSNDDKMSKVFRCFKVHVQVEETKQTNHSSKKDGGWITAKAATSTRVAKIINYWCFNPGFGMEDLLNKNVRSIILTSGTLAPLKPLIAELGIPIAHRLENPHIVGKHQVCVKIVPFGPDKEVLISNYQNRDNPKYIHSLGRTILTVCPVVPDGLLVFFPSYPLMNKCVDSWQASGIWSQISRHKPIFVEPRGKEAFNTTMLEFYEKINDPSTKGACFMAVCRGKVSEGLDFADNNGRAVIITGLPFPPLKDPRVILKKKYLDDNRTKENELLTGQSWYALEATRAVNQAIGRVIRHRNDYGAILLCDSRFNQPSQKSQLSSWIQEHLRSSQQYTTFGPIIGELSRFFRNAEKTVIKSNKRSVDSIIESSDVEKSQNTFANASQICQSKLKFQSAHDSAIEVEKSNNISKWKPEDFTNASGKHKLATAPNASDFMSRLDSNISAIDFNECNLGSSKKISNGLVTIHKRQRTSPAHLQDSFNDVCAKKKKFKLIAQPLSSSICSSSQPSENTYNEKVVPSDRVELLQIIKTSLTTGKYTDFVNALLSYKKSDDFDNLFTAFNNIFNTPALHYLFKGMRRFVKEIHKTQFDQRIRDHL